MNAPLAIHDWTTLDEVGRSALLRRPSQRDAAGLATRVAAIVANVRERGDAALREYTAKFDGVEVDDLAVGAAEFDAATAALTLYFPIRISASLPRAKINASVARAPGVLAGGARALGGEVSQEGRRGSR